MKLLLQILFLLLTCFINLNAALAYPLIAKDISYCNVHCNQNLISKAENVVVQEARTALKSGIEATKISSYLTKAKTLGSVKYLENIINPNHSLGIYNFHNSE
jgi:hypothetical protein